MSQKSSPRSPRTPRSKSPSCDEGEPGAENAPTADELQEAVAEELRSPDRIMSQGQGSMRSRGGQGRESYQATSPQSQRVSYHPSVSSRPPTAPQSRSPSPRGASVCEDEPPPRQPSPGMSPANYGSRAASLGASRAASPEAASHMSKPTSYAEMAQDPEQTDDYCPDDGEPENPETYARGPSQPSMRTTPAASHPSMRTSPAYSHPSMKASPAYSHQPSMRESPAYSHPSMRGTPAYSQQASMRESPAYSHQPSMRESPACSHPSSMRESPACSHPSSMRESPAYSHQPSMRESPACSHPSMRGSPNYSQQASMRDAIGPSQGSFRQGTSGHPSMIGSVRQTASGYPSAREGTLPSSRTTPTGSRSPGMGTGVGPSAVTFGTRESMAYVQDAPSALTQRSGRESAMAESLACSRQTVRDGDSTGIGLSTSGLDPMGVDAATSAMSYMGPNDRSGGLGCIPGCKTFMRDIQNAVSSTPYGSTVGPMMDQSQVSYQRAPLMASPSVGLGAGGGGGGRAPRHHDTGYSTLPPPPPTPYTPSSYMRSTSPPPVDGEHHHHHEGHEGMPPERDERMVAALGHLTQFKKTPSYFRCGLIEEMDFLKICSGKGKEATKTVPGKVATFPEIPCLRQEDLEELVKCEASDVDSAWLLTSDERKTYKKPCPKQQKAQMSVKALVQAHAAQTCGKEYSPLEHPDPEDISPELAAAMMFSQERGIKMEECPNYTITSLFPDEPKPPFPEKIPASSISIVDRGSKDQEEMIEKSADVPSEGVSDSAYTRMKEKGSEDMGAQRSFDVDFAIGQSKREYVLVTQKPQRINKVQYRGGNSPPWFPGYFSAFPNEEGLKVVTSPSDLLHKAWAHSNPGNMPTSDVIVLE